MYRTEVKLRTNLLGEPANQHVRPLSEARYVITHTLCLYLFLTQTWLTQGDRERRKRTRRGLSIRGRSTLDNRRDVAFLQESV